MIIWVYREQVLLCIGAQRFASIRYLPTPSGPEDCSPLLAWQEHDQVQLSIECINVDTQFSVLSIECFSMCVPWHKVM